jgi:hypothetical protein
MSDNNLQQGRIVFPKTFATSHTNYIILGTDFKKAAQWAAENNLHLSEWQFITSSYSLNDELIIFKKNEKHVESSYTRDNTFGSLDEEDLHD